MPWVFSEYLLKGVFLGLLAYAALVVPAPASAGVVAICLGAGVLIALIVAAWQQHRSGLRPQGRWTAYLLFLALENPRHIFAGIIGGLFLGVMLVRDPSFSAKLLPLHVAGGAILGLGLASLRMVRHPWWRFGVGLAAAIVIVGGIVWLLHQYPEWIPDTNQRLYGLYLLLGLPFFYLLTFVGDAEESEAEVAAWCAALAIALWLIGLASGIPALIFLIPLTIYYVYTSRVLPGLRVFKHTLRGISYGRVGRPRAALLALRRAVALDPSNELARGAIWEVHRGLDAATIAADPDLTQLVDPHMCLDRVARLLTEPPTQSQLHEARHLLDLAERRDPSLAARITFWRAIAATHAKDIDAAAKFLAKLLDPTTWPADSNRRALVFPAWQLALVQHGELTKRVGEVELSKPGRRLEAIDAVEAILADVPQDAAAWGLKRILYAGLRMEDMTAGPVGRLDPLFAEQLGLAQLDDASRFRRGAEFLAIAALGLPTEAPRLLSQAADALEKHGDATAAREARQQGIQAGREIGHKQLSDAGRLAYFTMLKHMAEDDTKAGNLDAAAQHWQHFTEWERSGMDTLRTLADVHERRGDALAAIKTVEHALLYNRTDAELLSRRDKYYYSLTPDELSKANEAGRSAVSSDYCLTKAGQLLGMRDLDADLLDWTKHLSELALVMQPSGIVSRVIAARVSLRIGERDRALQLLEDVREQKPEKFASHDEQESWFLACRLLGDLYLNELDRPDLAISAYQDYRKSSKSGADTLYKLGQACERLGQNERAVKFFEQVIGYDAHPLAPDARDAVRRLKALVKN